MHAVSSLLKDGKRKYVSFLVNKVTSKGAVAGLISKFRELHNNDPTLIVMSNKAFDTIASAIDYSVSSPSKGLVGKLYGIDLFIHEVEDTILTDELDATEATERIREFADLFDPQMSRVLNKYW